MEINAQDQTLAVPRHRDGGPQGGPRTSRDTAAKLHNETLDRSRLLTVEQVADLLHVPSSWV